AVLLKVPVLTNVLDVEFPLKKLLPEGPALKVPLLVKVIPAPPKPARLPLVQFTGPAFVVSRLRPSVSPARVMVEAAQKVRVPEPGIEPPLQLSAEEMVMLPV